MNDDKRDLFSWKLAFIRNNLDALNELGKKGWEVASVGGTLIDIAVFEQIGKHVKYQVTDDVLSVTYSSLKGKE